MTDRRPASVLGELRAEHDAIQRQTWQNEADLMELLEEALNLYWDCLLTLDGLRPADDLDQALLYLGAAGFQSLQSVFNLIELGHYRHAAALVRVLVNEVLLSARFREHPESASSFVSKPDWRGLKKLASRLRDDLRASGDWDKHLANQLSIAIDRQLSFRAHVIAGELMRAEDVAEQLKQQEVRQVREELGKQRVPLLGRLLNTLEGGGLARATILDYRCDVELLHRHAHSAPEAILAEVVARDQIGGLCAIPRYRRGLCRYCGYRALVWSGTHLGLLTGHFARLKDEQAWTLRLGAFQTEALTWGEETQPEHGQLNGPN